MPDVASYPLLNQLLIDVGRSLLQYVGECWPWTSRDDEPLREAIIELVVVQNEQARRLTDLLLDRDWDIDFGTYPTEYTDLHYVALDYLLSQLLANQTELCDQAESVLNSVGEDPEVRQLLGRIHSELQTITRRLEQLVSGRLPGSKPATATDSV